MADTRTPRQEVALTQKHYDLIDGLESKFNIPYAEMGRNAIKRIEALGLYIIYDPRTYLYAVSIDEVAFGRNPSDEQVRECNWHARAAFAAILYIIERENRGL